MNKNPTRRGDLGLAGHAGQFAGRTYTDDTTVSLSFGDQARATAAQASARASKLTANRAAFHLAGAADTSAEDLKALALSKSEIIRLSVAGNANTPADTIYQLAQDGDRLIADAARRNPAYEGRTAGERFRKLVDRVRRGPAEALLAA